MTARIRAARDGDGAGLARLIGQCWAEYPGCVLDLERELPELRAVATHYRRLGGRLWVAEIAGRIAGSVGLVPSGAGVELVKLYVAPEARKRGLGTRLVRLAEGAAGERGADAVELWTDTRFTDAHRLYEGLGYERQRGMRALDDLSKSIEHRYLKRLRVPDRGGRVPAAVAASPRAAT